MPKKTKDEIAAEIAALQKLTPVGPFARKTAATIDAMVDVLKAGAVDDTCDEWNDLTEEQQAASWDAFNWMSGTSKAVPSEDFGALVKRK